MSTALTPDAVLPFVPVSIASACTTETHELLKRSSSWPALVAATGLKPWVISPGMHLEMANCPGCNSTISIEVRTIPACPCCNGEGAVPVQSGSHWDARFEDCSACGGTGDEFGVAVQQ